MTFNNIQALAAAAVFAINGRVSDTRAAAFEGMAISMLKTNGRAGFAFDENLNLTQKVVSVSFTTQGYVFDITRNLTADTFTINNIMNA